MNTAEQVTADKPCHNCRRQRLRCDRSLPRCDKCARAGRECLGYGTLFRWTGAVASRGKLAGRTSSAPVPTSSPAAGDGDACGSGVQQQQQQQRQQQQTRSRLRRRGHDAALATATATTATTAGDYSSSSASPAGSDLLVGIDSPTTTTATATPLDHRLLSKWRARSALPQTTSPASSSRSGSIASSSNATSGMQLINRWRASSTSSSSPGPARLQAPYLLTDPLFQDLGNSYRHYLSYFTNRLCRDLVSQDAPHSNPFRNLLPLTKPHPLLQHIIVAAAAAHMSNLFKSPLRQLTTTATVTAETTTTVAETVAAAAAVAAATATATTGAAEEDRAAVANRESAAKRAMQDALVAKHRALHLMRATIENMDSRSGGGGDDDDVVVALAAALFFVNLELLESGRHGWQAHLEGAGKIMSRLQPAKCSDNPLWNYILSDCHIYIALGSAVMSSKFQRASCFQPSHTQAILSRTAGNNYACCPPIILQILCRASELFNEVQDGTVASDEAEAIGLALLLQAQRFDVAVWARKDAEAAVSLLMPMSMPTSVPMEGQEASGVGVGVERRGGGAAAAAAGEGIGVAAQGPSLVAVSSSRLHVGSAHRLATCLYILQVAPTAATAAGGASRAELADELFAHLAQVPRTDANFKGTSWPTFVAGLEAEGEARRAWVTDRLRQMAQCCPWGFLYTAMETLQTLWAREGGAEGWLRVLKDPEMNCLVV